MSSALDRLTPQLIGFDSRALPVRSVAYHRHPDKPDTQRRIAAGRYDCIGRLIASWDARLSALREKNSLAHANQKTLFSLSATALTTYSSDAGWQAAFIAANGQQLDSWDNRGTHWQNHYDENLRSIARTEQPKSSVARVAQRRDYAAVTPNAMARNSCGRLLHQYDDVGSHSYEGYDIAGRSQRDTRCFLQDLALPDWPITQSACVALLETGAGASSSSTYSALGDLLGQTDARQNRRRFTYSLSGNLQALDLILSDTSEHRLLQDVHYNAANQILRQTAGNHVTSSAEYYVGNGRLRSLSTRRADGSALQDLLYRYDPIGNVVAIEDRAQPTRYFANQRVEAANLYHYDTQYQLVEATGRETAGATPLEGALPALSALPVDNNQLLNYRQLYQYDAGGNMVELQHIGHHTYTRRMQIAAHSNRALPIPANEVPPDLEAGFDSGGNLQALAPGQTLLWDAAGQLAQVNALTRENDEADSEIYRYDSAGQRLRKVGTRRTKVLEHVRDARYLPGLELRTNTATGETLDVISVPAGRCNLRCLHWQGRPRAGLANDQLRYSVDDHLGSSTLELDAQAQIISHEGYYPYGGTAWWAARSALEASYKTIRYSGQERDASGLYYYGYRYYAPWLQRWISADPQGDIDGLNRYRMVGNSPVGHVDAKGLFAEDFNWINVAMTGIAILLMGTLYYMGQLKERSRNQAAQIGALNDKLKTRENIYSQERAEQNQEFKSLKEEVSFLKDSNVAQTQQISQLKRDTEVLNDRARQISDLNKKLKETNHFLMIQNNALTNEPATGGENMGGASSRRSSNVSTGSTDLFLAGLRSKGSSAQSSRRGSTNSLSSVGSFSPTPVPQNPQTLNLDDFFNSSAKRHEIHKYVGMANTAYTLIDELDKSIRDLAEEFVTGRSSHAHSSYGKHLSLDIRVPGAKSGRGDYRLLFTGPDETNVYHFHTLLNHEDAKKLATKKKSASTNS